MSPTTQKTQDISALAENVREEFALAERKIKRLDRMPVGLLVPPVNELRYCAFHLLRAQVPRQGEDPIDELEKAKNHCHRAIHDCIEMELLYNIEKSDNFSDDYKDISVTDIFSNYIEMRNLTDRAREYVVARSKNGISDDENKLREPNDEPCDPYEEYNEISEKLTKYIDSLPIIREELNKKIKAKRRNVLLAVLAIVVSSVSVTFAALSYFGC